MERHKGPGVLFIGGPLHGKVKPRDSFNRLTATIEIPVLETGGFGVLLYRLYDNWPVKYLYEEREDESTETG